MVLYSYNAQDENDLSVERGQCVTVLNSDDPDWFWVSKFDGQEGFVPSGFIYPLDAIQRQRKFMYQVSSLSEFLYCQSVFSFFINEYLESRIDFFHQDVVIQFIKKHHFH